MKDISYSLLMIALCLLIGKAIAHFIGGLPGSLYGMLIFSTLLHIKWLNANRISSTIAWLIKHMGICFVPAGVGIINHYQLIKNHGIALVAITFISTFILLSAVGLLYEYINNKNTTQNRNNNKC